MSDLKKLKLASEGFSILYVEDNKALRNNAGKLLHKLLDTVDITEDGVMGLELFKENEYDIVITDVRMPNMDGMELTKEIKNISPKTKVVIMSAFDESEYLYKAIELSVFRYLKKPVNINELVDVLYSCVQEIKEEQNSQLFNTHLKNVFNYQSSIVVMMKDSILSFTNQMFLNYFNVDSLEEFKEIHGDLGNLFLEHDGFLYNKSDTRWFDEVSSKPQKLYNIKLQDKDGNLRHFILKYQKIPDEESYGILSFDDITELNLLQLYDEKTSKNDEVIKDTKAMYKLLEVLQRNNAKVELHNFYKGLSITNDAVISELSDENITLKTKYLQLKAIQFERKTLIISEALPQTVLCSEVIRENFDKQSVLLGGLSFTKTSPVLRKTVRVVPEEKHSVSLFLNDNKFRGDAEIEDISLDAVKLKLGSLPAGLEKGDKVHLDIVLEMDSKPLIINTEATMFRKSESKRSFSIVFMFVETKNRELVKYITKRQMAIIREFKGMQNG